MEPHKLKKWKTDSSQGDIAYFYTCARPGRSGGPKGRVSDQVISAWGRRTSWTSYCNSLPVGPQAGQYG